MGFIKWLNKILNPNHNWFDYNRLDAFVDNTKNAVTEAAEQLADPAQITNWVNSQTGAHMLDSERERNEMQMQNQEDIYQRQVIGMQKAGVNPALMYGGSGPSSAPSAPSPQQPGLNMSDIMQAMLLNKQGRLMESQIRNTDAKTDREAQETERLKLINQYYPQVTETQINEMLSRIGLNDQEVEHIKAKVDLIEVEKSLKEIDKIIKQAEADESSAFFKARRELTEAQSDKEKAEKRELVARAFIEEVEGKFMRDKGFKMGSSEVLAICSAIASLFGIDSTHGVGNAAFTSWLDSFSKPGGLLQTWFEKLLKEKGDGSIQFNNSR